MFKLADGFRDAKCWTYFSNRKFTKGKGTKTIFPLVFERFSVFDGIDIFFRLV